MPLHVRSISVSAAVICFFGIAFIGWISGLSPFTCCKRALTAAIVVYTAALLAVKAINTILVNAMIKSKMNQQKEKTSDSGD
jgi:hypothetical protein